MRWDGWIVNRWVQERFDGVVRAFVMRVGLRL